MTEPLRKVEKLVKDNWEVIRLSEIKKGDTFRMTEPDESQPFVVAEAISDAYPQTNENGVETWGVEVLIK